MRGKYLFLSFTFILIISLIYLLFFSYDSTEEIALGNIKYSKTCGWINWEHAIPSNAANLLDSISKKSNRNDSSYSIRYAQRMKYSVGGIHMIAESYAIYSLPASITKAQEKQAAIKIFLNVSEEFEKMQGEFPFTLAKSSQASSFRKGDLMGNLLSFHLASTGQTREQFQNSLNFISTEEAIRLWKEEKSNTEHLADIKERNCILNALLNMAANSDIEPLLIKKENRLFTE